MFVQLQLDNMKILNDWKLILMLCITLGLAPFLPEPHIWGKLKWIWGGAVGMQTLDWLDTLFHGLPWLLLVRFLVVKIGRAKRWSNSQEQITIKASRD